MQQPTPPQSHNPLSELIELQKHQNAILNKIFEQNEALLTIEQKKRKREVRKNVLHVAIEIARYAFFAFAIYWAFTSLQGLFAGIVESLTPDFDLNQLSLPEWPF